MNILLLEVYLMVGKALLQSLQRRQWQVQWLRRAADAQERLKTEAFDLLLLDLGLPDGDGVDFIHDLRGWSNCPVIVLSARSGEADKIAALDAGADDYLVKPFGAGELMARVRAQLRRHMQQASVGEPLIQFGDICIDLAHRVVKRNGTPLHLTPIEYRLLTYLAAQPNRVVTHRQLLNVVWGPGHAEDTHYVRVHMANLRKKIEVDASMPKHVITEAGIGYRFVVKG